MEALIPVTALDDLNTFRRRYVKQRFSASLPFECLQHCNRVPRVVGTPTTNLFLLLLYNCNFTSVISDNVNIGYAGYLIRESCEREL